MARFRARTDNILTRGVSIWDVLGLTKTGQFFINGEEKTGSITHKILGGIDMSDKMILS